MKRSDGVLWTHYNPVRLHSGKGILAEAPDFLPKARRWLLLTSKGFTRRQVSNQVADILRSSGSESVLIEDSISPNPRLDSLENLTANARRYAPDAILAIGGGSVMDAAKVVAVSLTSRPGTLATVLRHGHSPHWRRDVALVAVPTTSGTGSEVTPFATVWDEVAQKKYSVTGDAVYPDLALLDPELTLGLPHEETLYGGLDATSHALESLWNRNRTPLTRCLAFAALDRIVHFLPVVLQAPEQLCGRQHMQEASLFAGLAICQTRTAIAHAISYPLTLRHGVPHGLACSFSLATILARHRADIASSDAELAVLDMTLHMLDALDLATELAKFVGTKEVLRVLPQMSTIGRSENFLFSATPEDVVRSSLARNET